MSSKSSKRVAFFLCYIAGFLNSLHPPALAAPPPITVQLGFVESPYETEAYPSSRYRERYEQAIAYSIGRVELRANACGYAFRTATRYFESADKTKAQELSEQLSKEKEAWIVLGPRRSDHFILAARGAGETPIVSPMANAAAVFELPQSAFTMEYPVERLAKVAIKAVQREKYGEHYGVFVDATCPPCRDFAALFARHSSGRLHSMFSIDTAGEAPDFAKLDELLAKTPVDFIVLPNFAALSANTILHLEKTHPKLRYLGSDGWGDGNVGYFNKYGFKPETEAICIRPDLPAPQLKEQTHSYSMDNETPDGYIAPFPSLHLIERFMETITQVLCQARPKTRSAFQKAMKGKPREFFRKKTGLSVVKLSRSKLVYGYAIASP